MNDLLYKNTFAVDAADCDMFGRLRPSIMLRLMQGAGWAHADALGLGNDAVWSRGLLWVIGRTVAEIDRLPRADEQITLCTWPGQQRKVFLPRSFEIADAEGRSLIRAKSIYLMMDRESRHTVTPQSVGLDVPGACERAELPDPASRVPFPGSLDGSESRRATYSELDINGHLNNTHYLSWGEDLLSVDYHRAHALRSLWVEYRREVRPENEVGMSWTLQDDTLYVKGGEFFNMKLGYGEV
ncbi:MAG: thioesterase [Oscillospiraceae bacterium]|nr:thioesterase [Oscillospiraceae bacterium]